MRTLGVSKVAVSATTLYFNQCVERVAKPTWVWLWLERMTLVHGGRPRLPQYVQPPSTSCVENSIFWALEYNCFILNSKCLCIVSGKEMKRVHYKTLALLDNSLSKRWFVWKENVIGIFREVPLYKESSQPYELNRTNIFLKFYFREACSGKEILTFLISGI